MPSLRYSAPSREPNFTALMSLVGLLVEHVKAHRSKKEMQHCRYLKNITEGYEKADEMAEDGAMEGEDIRAGTVQQ